MNEASSARSVLLGLAGILIVVLVGVAFFELRAARVEAPKLAELNRQHAAAEQRLQQLEDAAKAAPASAAPAKPAPPRASENRAQARAKAQAAQEAAQAYAKAFLAKYPQARAMLIEYQTRNMENYYAPFFKTAGLTQAQIDQFIARTAQVHLDSLVLNPNGGWNNGQPNLSAEDIRGMLGDEAYQQWQDANRARPALGFVQGIAISVEKGSAPLSADQALQLNQIVANNSPDYVAGKRFNPQTLDLDGVVAQAKPLMTDAQWQQAQTFLSIQVANRQLQALVQGGGQ
jgi:hypothetical protein